VHPRVWFGLGGWYSSGLPVELDGDLSAADFAARYSGGILEQVNFERGRIRPSASFDLSAGSTLWSRNDRSLRLKIEVTNVFDRLNVINFAGLLSGTALGSPRRFAINLETSF
jgi:outer membrane receptor for Fe3+-dicitrate